MKKIAILLFAAGVALSGCHDGGDNSGYRVLTFKEAQKLYPKTINASDFGAVPSDGKDDAAAIRKAVAEAKKIVGETSEGVRIAFAKGDYDLMTFDGAGAVEIRDAKKIMLDGNGSTFVHHKMRTNFPIIDSEDIALANMNFDAAILPFAGATVTAVSKDGHYFDCEVIPPHIVREMSPKAVISFDIKNDSMGVGMDSYQLGTKLKIKKLSDTTMRVPMEKYSKLPKIGETVIVRYEVYGPGVSITEGAKNIRYYNLKIWSHPGMGIHGSDTENILIDNLAVESKSKELFMSATADATHFNYCRGRIDILNSKFEKQGDDATNVHQMYWMVTEKIDPQNIKVEWGKKRDGSFPTNHLPHVGDKIAFGAQNNWLRMETFAKVAKVEANHKEKFAVISLETPLPDYITKGMPMANDSSNPVLTIKNCKVRGNRARGFLIKVADATVEDCVFERTSLPAILMENDADYWYEGCMTRDVKIKNCTFKECNFWGARAVGVSILDAAKFSKGMPSEGFVNGKTTVEDCTFIGCGETPIDISQTADTVIKNNVIK